MTPRPWHLWIIGLLALLWNSMGAFDYLMTQTQNSEYMKNFSEAQLDYFYTLPTWSVAAWALAIWSAVLASILLLLRNKASATLFMLSLIALVVTNVYSYGISNAYEVMGGQPSSVILPIVIFIVALCLAIYSKKMSALGQLK